MLANFENTLYEPVCENQDVSQFKYLILLA
jgi:hypothetical protein